MQKRLRLRLHGRRRVMRGLKRIGNMRFGASSLCLVLLLNGCGTLSNLLPPTRVVVACPPELVYQARRVFPALPDQLTNRSLEDYALALVEQIKAEWLEADQVAAACREYLKVQGLKP